MKHCLALVLATLLPISALAEGAADPDATAMIRPVGDTELSEFLWIKRPVIVFADTPADPRFGEQIERFRSEMEMLLDRDVVVLTDTDPAALSSIRTALRPRGFQMVLVGKDGTVKLRKPFPYSVRELTRTIDKMPMRQREIRERRGDG